MIFHETPIKGAFLIELQPHVDERGQFARAWCREEFARKGIEIEVLQANVSINPTKGTMRGLHWQVAPFGEAKLVRCVRGSLFDVIVDIDPTSPTYRAWFGVTLSPDKPQMLYVPQNCAHGFQTLVDDTEANYLVSTPYTATAGRGLRYDDPAVGVTWPLPVSLISKQDASWPLLDAASVQAA
jgi:dTDP-4-dehydrorhamnose 3,5-epimerase